MISHGEIKVIGSIGNILGELSKASSLCSCIFRNEGFPVTYRM